MELQECHGARMEPTWSLGLLGPHAEPPRLPKESKDIQSAPLSHTPNENPRAPKEPDGKPRVTLILCMHSELGQSNLLAARARGHIGNVGLGKITFDFHFVGKVISRVTFF